MCKNEANVVLQVLKVLNAMRPQAQALTALSTTTVAATRTATAVSVSTILVTSQVTVVPTTVVSVYTSLVTETATYACYTTMTSTSAATATATPTITTVDVSVVLTTTTVTAAAQLYYLSVIVPGASSPSYIASSTGRSGHAVPVEDTDSAQIFAILQAASSDTLYNLVGVGPGDFEGNSLGAESGVSMDDSATSPSWFSRLEPIYPEAEVSSIQEGGNFDYPAESSCFSCKSMVVEAGKQEFVTIVVYAFETGIINNLHFQTLYRERERAYHTWLYDSRAEQTSAVCFSQSSLRD